MENEHNNKEFTIKSDFTRKDVLGRGAYGVVFKGILVDKDGMKVQDVAIKRLEIAREETDVSSSREIMLKRLNHPNVVQLYVEEEDVNFLYYAMELCEASLDRVFLPEGNPKKYNGPLPSEVEFMFQLSLGLNYIHSQNIVHRDIKPENVLISTSEGQVTVKWADFGFSKNTKEDGTFSMSGFRGTKCYWAPEMFTSFIPEESSYNTENNNAGSKIKITNMADVFALACVFFQFLTKGIHPFGGNEDEVSRNIPLSNPINLSKLASTHFSFDIIKRMLLFNVHLRLGLQEILPLLMSLMQIMKTSPKVSIDDAYQKINTERKELFKLCSLPDPDEQQIKMLTQIVREDTIGLVNNIDENGNFPLLLLCRNNQSASLIQCMKVLLMKNHPSNTENRDLFGSVKCDQGVNLKHKNKNGKTALMYLCESCDRGDKEDSRLHLLIETIVDINANDGSTVLHTLCRYYVRKNLIDLVRLLIEKGVDVNAKDPDGETALLLICRRYTDNNKVRKRRLRRPDTESKIIDLVRLLVEKGVDANAKNSHGETALHLLCRNYPLANLVDMVQLLIEKGIDVKEKNSDGDTALHLLCQYYFHHNLIDLVQLLIGKGIDVKEKNSDGDTVLHLLCRYYIRKNLIDLVRLLIEGGVEVNAKTSNGWTALHILCRYYTHDNLIDLIRLLIEKGANVRVEDSYGETAFHFMCRHYRHENITDLALLLIERGTDVMVKDSYGCTALHLICEHYTQTNLIILARLMIAKGVDVNAKKSDGRTALHLLCQYYIHDNLIDLARLLIERGVDVRAEDTNGWTALHLLCYHYTCSPSHLINLVRLLIVKGANANAKDPDGRTVLHILCRHYHHHANIIDLIGLLIKKRHRRQRTGSRWMDRTSYIMSILQPQFPNFLGTIANRKRCRRQNKEL